MKKLIIIRHGSCNRDMHLSELGEAAISQLVTKVLPYLEGITPIGIFSAPSARTRETAALFSDALVVPVMVENILESDDAEGCMKVIELIHSQQNFYAALIMVTHMEVATFLSTLFAAEEWGVNFEMLGLKRGEAWVIDCEARTRVHVGLE